MKKYLEYCEVICPPHFLAEGNVLLSEEPVFVSLGASEGGLNDYLKILEKENGKPLFFKTALDAVNWLSKNQGWYLSKTFTTTEGNGRCFEHWVMAREIKIDD